MKKKLYVFLCLLMTPFFALFAFTIAICSKLSCQHVSSPRLVWGCSPIINNSYWSRAMKQAGFSSETFVDGCYVTINVKSDFDIVLQDHYGRIPNFLKYYLAFFISLFRYDVFLLSFEGYFLARTPYRWLEGPLLSVAGKKTVLIPYGSDAYVYRRIRSTPLIHGFMMSYPDASRRQNSIARRVDYWCAKANVVIHGFMAPDGFGRWDVLTPSALCLDLDQWKRSTRSSMADGISDIVTIAHAPNHRGSKGTEFVIDAVNQLKREGLQVELILIEKMQNAKVRECLHEKTDILIDQLIVTGHGLNGLEGMASGLPVICNLKDDTYMKIFRRWSYFAECPLVSAEPETLVDTLRVLVKTPSLRHTLGHAGRTYVEKYHGLDSSQFLFTAVLDKLYGRRDSLINLYHPLLGEYARDKPRIEHPLVDNKIV